MEEGQVQMVCRGCGTEVSSRQAYPFRCPRARDLPDVDHVLLRRLDVVACGLADAFGGDEPNPFVRYRQGLVPHVVGRAHGLSDAELVAMVRTLDAEIEAADGTGFRITPLRREDDLALALGLAPGSLWAKDETGNVSGSHKARHLMGIQIWLEMARRLRWIPAGERPALAIASCGNAALAAAVVARAAGERLRVFVPVEAEPSVVARLQALGAKIQPCPRESGRTGDPCMHAFEAARDAGSIPYGCQGHENGMTLDGGRTLGYEIVDQLRRAGGPLDHLVVQVGGGALAGSLVLALRDAVALDLIPAMPRIHTLQTTGAFPLHRAWSRLVDHLLGTSTPAAPDVARDLERARAAAAVSDVRRDVALAYAARHRAQFMWPWESTPHSIAGGILDDETYDWLLLVRAMLETNGVPLVATEDVLQRAHALARAHTAAPVGPTGSSGLAGVMELLGAGGVAAGEQVGIVLSGRQR